MGVLPITGMLLWGGLLLGWANRSRHRGVDGNKILRLCAAGKGRHGGAAQDAGAPPNQRVKVHVQALPRCIST
jgi:hypothetical protein